MKMKRYQYMKRVMGAVVALSLFLLEGQILSAAPIQVKLASIAPQGTTWGKALDQMSQEWSRATGGEVELVVYHNALLGGDERTVLQKLRTNQIQAAVFTSIGMNSISKKIFTLSCPFLIRNDAEMDYVLKNLGSTFEDTIKQEGFQLVAWSRVGWIRFFSRNPVSVPADLKRQKLAGPVDMPELGNMFKTLGYTVISLDYSDILMALTTNRTDAVFQIPPYVAAMQVFKTAKNMLPLDISPVLGGIVMNQRTWGLIPVKHRQKLLDISRRIAYENDLGAQKLGADMIDFMAKEGLSTSPLSPAQEQLWLNEAANALPTMLNERSSVLDADVYHEIDRLLRVYRNR